MFPLAEHAVEQSKVDQLYDILAKSKEPKSFYEMTDQVFEKGEIEADDGETLARLYTTLSLDGRFLSLGNNLWALRNWYPLDQREDDAAKSLGQAEAHKRKSKLAEDGFDDYDESYDEDDADDDSDDDDDQDLADNNSDDDDYDDHDDDDDVQRIKRNVSIDDEEE
ncbi:DNA-directed RNA polymerase subunit delta [Sporolactobacillus sp. KGMB 08714]|uniref:DNA-directed RNA polymerase subunit delta n=1 Tax=Sporolactobacillus sp. KGMB 08714 TaxID=3064704 RepID=UPI002FBD7706